MKKILYVRLNPEKNIDDAIEETRKLTVQHLEKYTISRAASHAAIGLLDQCVNKSSLEKKFDPEIRYEVPSPGWFNAFYKLDLSPRMPMEELLDNKKSRKELINSMIQQETNDGAILISEALADTYLYLSKTRRYLLNELDRKKTYTERNKKIPSEVIEEIRDLYNSWKYWKYDSRLDLSKSLDLQNISSSMRPEDLSKLVLEKHSYLVNMILFILLHEYGHLLLIHDKEMQQRLNNLARDLLNTFIESTERIRPDDQWCELLRDRKDIFNRWQTEIAADIFGLELLSQLISKSSLGITLAILSLIIGIGENSPLYSGTYYQDEYNVTHPVSFIRFLLSITYLARKDWDIEEFTIINNVVMNCLADLREVI